VLNQGVINHYRDYLSIPEGMIEISLSEGNTPLIEMASIPKLLKVDFELWIKFEGMNPTGSFKDRGMTVAISEAAHRGAKIAICASTGNTAASAAAYSARAGMRSVVIIPTGKVAAGKLAGAIAYGAEIVQINGSFDKALDLVVQIAGQLPVAMVNSINPYRLEGQKTAAFEICESLNCSPDILALPVGNAGNITAYWMGFNQYHDIKGFGLPQILGVQASGSAPLVLGHPVENPETIATAIRIGKPARGEQALEAAQDSGGQIISATDDEIINAQKLLAHSGLWVEPASAAGLAGLIKLIKANQINITGKKVVTVCTGHGLKDPDVVIRDFNSTKSIEPDVTSIERLITHD
jgi:threonine synthase